MITEPLEWDSAFFGCRVFRVEVEAPAEVSGLQDGLSALPADVIYVFVPAAFADCFREPLLRAGGVCYDRKVTYRKVLSDAGGVRPTEIGLRLTSDCSPELLRLAFASGWCSRFFLDPHFRPSFEALYSRWIMRACSEADGRVLVIEEDGRLVGMTSLMIADGVARIGLVAVDEESRGKGLGRKLMGGCDRLLLNEGVPLCEVATQQANVVACRLYESSGYDKVEETDVWHVWRAK